VTIIIKHISTIITQ